MQALRFCGDILRENGLPVQALTLIGGGAKSGLWGQMAADMFGAHISVHATPHEATSLGAALAAGVGIGWYRTSGRRRRSFTGSAPMSLIRRRRRPTRSISRCIVSCIP